jgi:hypothetical protein
MARPVRPGWLTAIAVISIVLGALGMLSVVVGVLGQLFSAQAQQWVQQWMQGMAKIGPAGGGMPPEALKMQQELPTLMIDMQARWRIVMLVLLAINFVLSALLLTSGIGTLKLARWGRTLLLASLAGTILFEIVQVIPGLVIQYDTMQITQEFMSKMISASQRKTGGNAPPGMNPMGFTAAITNATFAISLVMACGWVLVKVTLYGAAIYYLRTPLIRSLFANQAGAAEVQPIDSMQP